MTDPFEDYFMYIVTPLAVDSYKYTDIDRSLIYHSGEELPTATVGTSASASAENRNKAVLDLSPSLARLHPTSSNCRHPTQLSLVAPIIVSNETNNINEKRLLVNLPAPIIIRPCTSTSSQSMCSTAMTETTSKLGNSAKNLNIFPFSSIPMPIICSGTNSADNQYSLKMSHKDLVRAQNDVLPNFTDRQGHQQLYSAAAQIRQYHASQLPSDGVIAANKLASLIAEVKKESLRRPSEGCQSDHMAETMLRSAIMGTKQKLDELLAGSGNCLGSLPIEISSNPELRNFTESRNSTEIRPNWASTSWSSTHFKVQPSTSKTSLFPTPISTPIDFSPSPESSENQHHLSQLSTPDSLSSEVLAAKCEIEPHSSSEDICQIPSGFDSSGRLLGHIKTSIRSEIEQRREFLITVKRKHAVVELKEKLRQLFPPGTGSALIQRLSIDYSGVQRAERSDSINSEKGNIIKREINEDHHEKRRNCSKRHRPHPVQISDSEMRQMRTAIERKMRKIDRSRLCS